MKLAKALTIVYELADQNKLTSKDVFSDTELIIEGSKQRIALDTVHDFIVNNFGEETNGRQPDCP